MRAGPEVIPATAQSKPSCTQEGGVSSDAGLSALETKLLPRYQGRAAWPSAARRPHSGCRESHREGAALLPSSDPPAQQGVGLQGPTLMHNPSPGTKGLGGQPVGSCLTWAHT